MFLRFYVHHFVLHITLSYTEPAGIGFKDIPMWEIKLHELKLKSPTELLSFAEEHDVENASIMRKHPSPLPGSGFEVLRLAAEPAVDVLLR